jgi:hypothetical protein
MVDEVLLRNAVDTAWTVYLATHWRFETSESDTEVLTCSGLAYLDRVPKGEW